LAPCPPQNGTFLLEQGMKIENLIFIKPALSPAISPAVISPSISMQLLFL
jgi:hypothetical protein